jgi:arsenate reductase (thioredoxin)
MKPPYNVLFLCTGNSSRSILAEAILKKKGPPNFHAFSAGSHPAGHIHAHALKQLAAAGLPSDGLRSKSWDEFAVPSAPQMDFVITLCDSAAREVCPVWPGQPIKTHWGMPDPGYATDMDRSFREAFATLDRRIAMLVNLPLETLNAPAIQKELDRIADS